MNINDAFDNAENIRKPSADSHAVEQGKSAPEAKIVVDSNLMISQFAEYYTAYGDDVYRKTYLMKTRELGISETDAANLFNFECDVCRRYNKGFLLLPGFVKAWFIGLHEPVFISYPKSKDELCKEFYLTLAELCKLIDEAEWHYWNSHELELSDEVWDEIEAFRVKGEGAAFVVDQYLPSISEKYSVSMDALLIIANHYGAFLKKYKWGY